MNVILVYNPKSGSALPAAELRALCKKHGIGVERLVPVNDEFRSVLAPFIKKHATIAVAGGDGTLSSVAGLMAGTKAVFAPLPGGTLNHFTKDLGIPQDMDTAIARLSRAKVRTVDVAEVNGTVFINNSSIGLYPSSLRMRDRFERYVGKWTAAVVASIRALVRFRTYTVTIDGETFHTPFVFVGNNAYSISGPGGVARTVLTKGVLSVFIARTTSRLALFKIALFALVGKAYLLDEFDKRETARVTIASKRSRLSVSRDGEVVRVAPPLAYASRPGDLRILY